MHVEGGLGLFASVAVLEVKEERGLVGALVLGEARVAVNSGERASTGARISYEEVADPIQSRGEIADQSEGGVAEACFESRLVCSNQLFSLCVSSWRKNRSASGKK
jgi:hypothetical protein